MAAGDGLVTMTPTSIAVTGVGSSASIQSDGSVDFDTAATLSLNGVFATGMDNYLIVMRYFSSGATYIASRLRLSGTDASGSNYTYQILATDGTAVGAARTSSTSLMRFGYTPGTKRGGMNVHVYGPNLAQPTAARSVTAGMYLDAETSDHAATHSLSTAYDGITLYPESGTFTGSITVFGYEE